MNEHACGARNEHRIRPGEDCPSNSLHQFVLLSGIEKLPRQIEKSRWSTVLATPSTIVQPICRSARFLCSVARDKRMCPQQNVRKWLAIGRNCSSDFLGIGEAAFVNKIESFLHRHELLAIQHVAERPQTLGESLAFISRHEPQCHAPQVEDHLQRITTSGTRVAGGVLRLRCVRTMPSMIVMPMPGRSPSLMLSRMVLPGECCARSMMTKSAARPTSIRPQSSARMRAVLPVAKQRAISAGTSPSDDNSEIMRRMPSGCTPEPAGESVPRMTRESSFISCAIRNV